MKVIPALAILLCLLTSLTEAKDIERSDYKITVPESCTVDPEEPDIDLDHMTTINLPNDNSMIIMVLDDVTALDGAFGNMRANYRSKVQKGEEKPSTLAAKRKGQGVIVSGRFNGARFCFEVLAFPGKKKGFAIVSTYLVSEEKEARKIIQEAIDSFVIKE